MRLANWDRLEAGADVMLRVTRKAIYDHPGEPPAEREGFKRVRVIERLPAKDGWLVRSLVGPKPRRSYRLTLHADQSFARLYGHDRAGRPLRYEVDQIAFTRDERLKEEITRRAATKLPPFVTSKRKSVPVVRWRCTSCAHEVTANPRPSRCPACGDTSWTSADIVTSEWGTPGSQAEAYKRLIMANRMRKTLTGKDELTDDEIHAVVERELGVGKAGPKSYVQWYRNWLTKHGHKPPPRF